MGLALFMGDTFSCCMGGLFISSVNSRIILWILLFVLYCRCIKNIICYVRFTDTVVKRVIVNKWPCIQVHARLTQLLVLETEEMATHRICRELHHIP